VAVARPCRQTAGPAGLVFVAAYSCQAAARGRPVPRPPAAARRRPRSRRTKRGPDNGRGTRQRVETAWPFTASTWAKMQVENWYRGYALPPFPAIAAHSRAQRVGVLDHIGTAAGGGAGREQYKS